MAVSAEDMERRIVRTFGELLVMRGALDAFLNTSAGESLDDATQALLYGLRDIMSDIADQHGALMDEI